LWEGTAQPFFTRAGNIQHLAKKKREGPNGRSSEGGGPRDPEAVTIPTRTTNGPKGNT